MWIYKQKNKEKMKKIWLFITLSLLTSIPLYTFSAGVSSVNDIFDSVEFIKKAVKFNDITIKSDVPYDLVQWAIKKYCPQSAVDQANKELEPLREVWVASITKPGINKSLSDRFDMVKWLILEQKKDNQYKYCKDSYLLFSILKTTQELYTWEKDTKKTNTKTNNTQNNTQKTKITSESHNSATTKKLDFTFIHDTSWLPNDTKKSFSESTEIYLQEIMADLININILDKDDLMTLNNNIEVTYLQSCNVTEWSFRVVRNKQTGAYTFKGIKLIIAYCDKNNTPERQKRHVQQILAHELWHYIYFFKDKNPSKFSEICWDNGKMNCLPEEFVSNYAKKSKEEDYAESFAYWYLYNTGWASDNQHGAAPDNPINRRARYFEDLFEEEEEDDDEEK